MGKTRKEQASGKSVKWEGGIPEDFSLRYITRQRYCEALRIFFTNHDAIHGQVIYRPDGAALSGGEDQQNAWRDRARVRACLVSAPTEMKSTPVSANSRKVSAVTLPDTSRAPPFNAFHRLAHLVGVEIIQHDNIRASLSAHRPVHPDFRPRLLPARPDVAVNAFSTA